MKRELERIEIPEEHEARERAWAVVQAAFAEHEPQPHRRSWKPAVAVVTVMQYESAGRANWWVYQTRNPGGSVYATMQNVPWP